LGVIDGAGPPKRRKGEVCRTFCGDDPWAGYGKEGGKKAEKFCDVWYGEEREVEPNIVLLGASAKAKSARHRSVFR
jgi:hypothetical protein